MDRYLEKEQVSKLSLQLVGVTAALIASKYEEIYPPEIKDFSYITDNAYSREDIIRMEQKMLAALNFDLNIPSSNRFLERYARQMGCTKKIRSLSQYLLELSLVESGMLRYRPSLTAAAALYLSTKLCCGGEPWKQRMEALTGCGERTMDGCAKDMVAMLQAVPRSQLQAVRRKFSAPKFEEVAARVRIGAKKPA